MWVAHGIGGCPGNGLGTVYGRPTPLREFKLDECSGGARGMIAAARNSRVKLHLLDPIEAYIRGIAGKAYERMRKRMARRSASQKRDTGSTGMSNSTDGPLTSEESS